MAPAKTTRSLHAAAPMRLVRARARCEPSPAMTSRSGAGTCAIARDREIHALHAFEPADDQRVVAVRPRAQPIGQRRRMVQALGGDAVERLQTSRGVVASWRTRGGTRRASARRARTASGAGRRRPRCARSRCRACRTARTRRDAGGSPTRPCAGAGEIGRKARRDQQIDRLAVARREIQQPPCRRLREQFVLRLRAERQRDELDLVAAMPAARRRAIGRAAPRRPCTKGTCASARRCDGRL